MKTAWFVLRSVLLWIASGLHFFLAVPVLVFLGIFLDARKHDSLQRGLCRRIAFLSGAKVEVRRSPGFDANRTSLDHARRRDAQILGEIAGYGAATDVHHLTQPQPEGDAALSSMRSACEAARVRPDQIGYVNAHGTGTPLNDAAEAAAINRWAGKR